MRIALVTVVALLLIAGTAAAADPKPGATVKVTCKAQPDQSYACYLPSTYTPKKQWPILYCFSPNANGDAFVQAYKDVCERRGWIVVGSMNSKNGPMEPIIAAIDAMWADTTSRFSLRKTMRYASGFSGGARVSFYLVEKKPENFSGVIAIGAGLAMGQREIPKRLAAWLMCGETDPNKQELDPLAKRFKEEGRPVHYENFPGGHVMPPKELMEKAVEWMDDQAAERKAERFEAALKQAAELQEAGEPVKAWRLLVETVRAMPDETKSVKAAEKLRKTLERDEKVKPEASALKKYDDAEKWLKKNADRIAKSKSSRAQASKKLTEIVTKYPGTWAAERAEKELSKLPPEK